MTEDGLLAPYRVLDLTNEKGYLCGRLLAELGADVIKVEPPGGDSGRRIGPFYRDVPNPEHSLFFWAYNLNKRGITLNLESMDGRELFRRLVAKADFVLESFPPGYLDSLGLGYAHLSEVNPGIVLTSISAFGQTGPYKDYKATDIVGVAMGAIMGITGDPDRPPVRVSAPQGWLLAGAQAFNGSMVALYHRALSGEGQHVDVSMQQSVILTLLITTGYPQPEFGGATVKRSGARRTRGSLLVRQVYPCKDGYISLLPLGGKSAEKSMRGLLKLLDEAGMAPERMKTRDWSKWDVATLSKLGTGGQAELDKDDAVFTQFFQTKTVQELYDAAVKHGIFIAPVSTSADLLVDPQLQARGFWVEVDHPELGITVTYPGSSAQGTWKQAKVRRRPPRIGEHNLEVYRDLLELSGEQIVAMRQTGVI